MASYGVMNDLMKRLMKTYHETGGTRWKEEEEDIEGLSAFDAQKLILAKKIESTRERMKERDDLMARRKGNSTKVIRLNNQVKNMIKVLKKDYNRLAQIQQKTEKKRSIFRKRSPERERLIQEQREDCELILKHIIEVEEMDKRRHARKDEGKGTKRDRNREKLLEESFGDGSDDATGESGSAGLRQMILQSNLPDDATQSNLPEIDISDSLLKVDEMKKKIDQGLDIFQDKLNKLSDMAKQIGDELDQQNIMLDDLDKKVDNTKAVLEKLNKKLDEARKATGNHLFFVFIIIIIIVLIALVIIGYILFNQFLRPFIPR